MQFMLIHGDNSLCFLLNIRMKRISQNVTIQHWNHLLTSHFPIILLIEIIDMNLFWIIFLYIWKNSWNYVIAEHFKEFYWTKMNILISQHSKSCLLFIPYLKIPHQSIKRQINVWKRTKYVQIMFGWDQTKGKERKNRRRQNSLYETSKFTF